MFANIYCEECRKCVAFTEAMIHPLVYCLECEPVVTERRRLEADNRHCREVFAENVRYGGLP